MFPDYIRKKPEWVIEEYTPNIYYVYHNHCIHQMYGYRGIVGWQEDICSSCLLKVPRYLLFQCRLLNGK